MAFIRISKLPTSGGIRKQVFFNCLKNFLQFKINEPSDGWVFSSLKKNWFLFLQKLNFSKLVFRQVPKTIDKFVFNLDKTLTDHFVRKNYNSLRFQIFLETYSIVGNFVVIVSVSSEEWSFPKAKVQVFTLKIDYQSFLKLGSVTCLFSEVQNFTL